MFTLFVHFQQCICAHRTLKGWEVCFFTIDVILRDFPCIALNKTYRHSSGTSEVNWMLVYDVSDVLKAYDSSTVDDLFAGLARSHWPAPRQRIAMKATWTSKITPSLLTSRCQTCLWVQAFIFLSVWWSLSMKMRWERLHPFSVTSFMSVWILLETFLFLNCFDFSFE